MANANSMPTNEDELAARLATGDEDALSELLERSHSRLAATLKARVGKRYLGAIDVEDVLQVTYIEAFLDIGEFRRAANGSVFNWLLAIARSNLIDAIRALRRKRRPDPNKRIRNVGDSYIELLLQLGTAPTTPSEDACRGEARDAVEGALKLLPPDYALVVRRHDLEGLPASAVAEEMRRSVPAVYMLKARAHDRLRRVLAGRGWSSS